MGKPKMWNISKTADRRAKWTKIWVSGYYSAHSEGTFHARFLEFVLGSFGAFCKISNFTILKLCSSPNFYLISSKLYTRYPNHSVIQAITFFGDLPKIQKLWHFDIFLSARPYAPGNFKVLFLPQFSSEPIQNLRQSIRQSVLVISEVYFARTNTYYNNNEH